jgi:bacillithiol biosynthesis deacetylase BshB1
MSDTSDPPLDLLAFGAHPDDVELCCGGLLAASAARGYRTGIVDLSRGELGSSGTPEIRAAEATRAAQILGLAVRENLALPDGWIDPGAGYDLGPEQRAAHAPLAKVVAVIRRLRPYMVVYPWTHERHPDHEAAGALVGKAVFFAGVRKFPGGPAAPLPVHHVKEALQYPMRHDLVPSFIVDISAVVDRKAAAIAAYASQLRPPTPTLIGSASGGPSSGTGRASGSSTSGPASTRNAARRSATERAIGPSTGRSCEANVGSAPATR